MTFDQFGAQNSRQFSAVPRRARSRPNFSFHPTLGGVSGHKDAEGDFPLLAAEDQAALSLHFIVLRIESKRSSTVNSSSMLPTGGVAQS